jgi:hypothetical protein
MAYRFNRPDSAADGRQIPDKAASATWGGHVWRKTGQFERALQIKNLLTVGALPRRKLQRKLRPTFLRIGDGDAPVQRMHDAADNREA